MKTIRIFSLIALSIICSSCIDNFDNIEFNRIGKNKVQILNCFKEFAILERNEVIIQNIGDGDNIYILSDSLNYSQLQLVVGYGKNCEVVNYKLNQ